MCAFFLVVNLLLATPAESQRVLWEHQLMGMGMLGQGTVRRGNGVVASQTGDSVWVTIDDGSVRILSIHANLSTTEKLFSPTPVSGRSTECRSSVSLVEPNGIVGYGVYSVIDVPDINGADITRYVPTIANS